MNIREETLQALARGYCTKKNEKKVLDPDLINAMADQILPLISSHEKELIDIISDMEDPNECQYDHHGYCQEHSWFDDLIACPQKRIKLLKLHKEGKEE